jgi:hypothetical protein
MSARGKCQPCAIQIQNEALTQISEHRGPWFDYWRLRVAQGVGGALLDRAAAEVGLTDELSPTRPS